MKLTKLIKVIALTAFCSNFALAQDVKDMVPQNEDMTKRSVKEDGWSKTAKISATGAINRHDRMIGQTQGTSYLLGANLEGGLNYKQGDSELLNTLTVNQGTSKIPGAEHYIKTADTLKLESLYLYTLPSLPMIAPYAKASVETSIFQNTLHSVTPMSLSGAKTGTGSKSLRLTDGLNPLIIKVSAGAFYTPIDTPDMKLRFTAGVGHMNVAAEGLNIVSDAVDATGTRNVVISELEDFNQTGLVVGANLTGNIDKKTGYDLGYEGFLPLAFDEDLGTIDDPSAFDVMNHEFYAKLNTKLTEYFSLNYEYRWKKIPQLLDNSQQSHLLGVSVSYVLF